MPIPFLASFAMPRLLGPILVAVLLAGAVGYHKFAVWKESRRADNAEQARDLARAEKAEAEQETEKVRADLATANGNLAVLRITVRKQNDAITALHANARAYEAAAKARAVDVLRRGERERLALKLDTKFGPAAMNLWFSTMFGN